MKTTPTIIIVLLTSWRLYYRDKFKRKHLEGKNWKKLKEIQAMNVSIRVILIILPGFVYGQDVLVKTDSSKWEVKILEVTKDSVKFKTNNDNLNYILSKKDIARMKYEDGQSVMFDATNDSHITSLSRSQKDSIRNIKREEAYLKVTKHKNIAFLNILGLGVRQLSVSYIREVFNGLVLLQVPFSFSLKETRNRFYNEIINNNNNGLEYLSLKKIFDLGLGVYFSTTGKRKVMHFIGPLYKYGRYEGFYRGCWSGLLYYHCADNYVFIQDRQYLMINNGLLYRVTPHFNMMVNVAVGGIIWENYVQNDPNKINPGIEVGNNVYYPYHKSGFFPAFHLGFNLGYRF